MVDQCLPGNQDQGLGACVSVRGRHAGAKTCGKQALPGGAFLPDPLQPFGRGCGQAFVHGLGQICQCGVGQIALKCRPDARRMGQILRFAVHHRKPRERSPESAGRAGRPAGRRWARKRLCSSPFCAAIGRKAGGFGRQGHIPSRVLQKRDKIIGRMGGEMRPENQEALPWPRQRTAGQPDEIFSMKIAHGQGAGAIIQPVKTDRRPKGRDPLTRHRSPAHPCPADRIR